MRIFKTKLYRVDYKGTHGGGVDHIRGRVLLENYPWIIEAAANGEIELTKVNQKRNYQGENYHEKITLSPRKLSSYFQMD